nr:hypothetical protein [Desulfobacterales bacterium]
MTHPSIKAPCPPRLNRLGFLCILGLLLLAGLVIGGCSASSPSSPGPDFEPARAWVDQIQAPPELKRAIKDGRQTTIAVA